MIWVIRSGVTSSSEGVIHLKFQNSSLMYKGTGLRCVKTVHFLMCAPWKPPKGFTNTSGFSFWSIVKMWPSLAIIGHFQGENILSKIFLRRLLREVFFSFRAFWAILRALGANFGDCLIPYDASHRVTNFGTLYAHLTQRT